MSSVKSPLTPADLHAALHAALVAVGENSCSVFVEGCDAKQFSALVDRAAPPPAGGRSHDGWLKASVGFAGAFSGTVEVALPEPLGLALVTSILSVPADTPLPDAQLFDGVGEFANMVCGAWLSGLGDRALFELRVPAVARMAARWNPMTESPDGTEMISLTASVNEMPVRVRVHAR
jgi:hypothetical protein